MLNTSSGGVFMYKTPTQGLQLLEDLSLHSLEWTCAEEMKGNIRLVKHSSQGEVAFLLKHRRISKGK